MFKKIIFVLFIFSYNSSIAKTVGEYTGLDLPRFVSTKTSESNLRLGASEDYPIRIKYIFNNFPLEIIDEYKDWRKIKDIDGNEGWMHKRLLKGNRYALINQPYSEPVQILNKPKGKVIGKIGKKNIVKIERCLLNWCLIEISNNKGWINKKNLWGVYENEIIKRPFYKSIINQIWKII